MLCYVVVWSPPGRLVGIHPAGRSCWLGVALGGLETVREAAEERRGVAFGNELVLGGTAFLLGAFRGEQVTEAGSATHELAFGGKLEAFGNGLFGLLHEKSGRKH